MKIRSPMPNMHSIDRALRGILGLGCLYVGFYDPGIIANALISTLVGLFGVVNVGSALFGFCPVYKLGGIRTNKAKG
ncbi:MAG: DUF2892 domain-containing protein [Alphaproteobacteria bacterium]|nr:DUF2892 domain-containing protein [Alphaproteobacteria bacterium]